MQGARPEPGQRQPAAERGPIAPPAAVKQQPVVPGTQSLMDCARRGRMPDDCDGDGEEAHHDCDLIGPSHIVSTTRNSAFPLIMRA
jgi:hypothetical protein